MQKQQHWPSFIQNGPHGTLKIQNKDSDQIQYICWCLKQKNTTITVFSSLWSISELMSYMQHTELVTTNEKSMYMCICVFQALRIQNSCVHESLCNCLIAFLGYTYKTRGR